MRVITVLLLITIVSVYSLARERAVPALPAIAESVSDTLQNTAAVTSADSIDVRKMVEAQIIAARNKQWGVSTEVERGIKDNVSSVKEVVTVEKPAANVMKASTNIVNSILLHTEYLIKGGILLLASLIAVIIIYFKRKSLRNKNTVDSDLKRNINFIRNEYSVRKENPKLSFLRKKLRTKVLAIKADEKTILKKAKEFRISQGELLLAVKLNGMKS